MRPFVPAAFLLVLAACASAPEEPSTAVPDAGETAAGDAARAGEEAPAGESPVGVASSPEPARPGGFVRPGSGVFIDSRALRRGAEEQGPGDVTLNFVEADVREVVRAVLGEALGESFVIDPEVKGTVTLETARPLARDQVLPVLEEVLRANGAALVRGEGAWQVVPLEKAPARARAAPAGRGAGAGYRVQVVPLRHVSADEVMKLLEPLVQDGSVLRADRARNVLLLGGTQAQRQVMLDLVETFDVDWLQGMSFALEPLDVAGAEEVAGELEAIFGNSADGPLSGLVRFVPIRRVNAILVIASRPENLRRAREWIDRLDRGVGEDRRRVYVYHVENADAAELAAVLAELFDVPVRDGITATALAPGRGAVAIAEAEGDVTAAAPAQEGNSPSLPRSRPRNRAQDGERPGLRIIPDPRTNALVLLATPQEFRMVRAALERLDLRPRQVLLEATIAEVTLNEDLRYGVQWFLEEGRSEITFSTASTGAVSPIFPGFNYVLSADDFRAVLSALEQVTDVNVISAPHVLVLDNQAAQLQVGDQVPVPVQSSVSVTDPDAPIVNTIEFRDTGVILEVRPRVNSGGLVIMEVRQEVSDVRETVSSGIDAPTIQQREIQSTVAVQSGETIALGGLIRDSKEKSVSGVPFLSRIPILGLLFSSTGNAYDRTELIVLITPRVIGSTDEARAVTEELRRRLNETFHDLESRL